MPPNDGDDAYLWDMLDAAKAIREFVSGRSRSDYLKDRMLRGAVERHIEIIGEAAGRLSESFKESHPEIPWGRMIAQRNVLTHEYGDIEHELIWKLVEEHLPDLIAKIEPLLPPLPPDKEK